MGILITAIVIAWVIYMIVKKHFPQAILLIAGIVLLLATHFLGTNPILAAKQSSGSAFLDIFYTIQNLLRFPRGWSRLDYHVDSRVCEIYGIYRGEQIIICCRSVTIEVYKITVFASCFWLFCQSVPGSVHSKPCWTGVIAHGYHVSDSH